MLAPVLVLLGACVFAWGLKYKLSLYDPPHALSHRMPAAKLLTGKERAPLPVIDVRPVAAPPAPILLAGLLFTALLFRRSGRPAFGSATFTAPPRVLAPVRVPGRLSFVRPPPPLL
jgi:hypothetical protein